MENLASPYSIDAEILSDPRAADRVGTQRIFFDGVFKGDYSLAIVNRSLADALIRGGANLTCHSLEADWQNDRLLNDTREVKSRMRADYPEKGRFDIHIRNTWPPKTHDMVGKFNAYVCFAWEEMEFPSDLVERFNRDLDLVMAASNFVKDALLHSGVTIPVEVVGEGCDHVLRLGTAACPLPAPRKARILHVSSGFPRKGVDCLLNAFQESFTIHDDVELVIKTFANPDSIVSSIIQRISDIPERPPIAVVENSYSREEMIALYKSASVIVAPSRGEGFGLPLAEAMALGIPVVTTNYSGQLDFCRSNTSWLVDYTLSPSKAHVAGGFSTWAEPDIGHLGRQMRAALERTAETAERTEQAKKLLSTHFTWARTARRALHAIAKTETARQARPRHSALPAAAPMTLDIVSSWQQACGIATYSSHLYAAPALRPHVAMIMAQEHGDAGDTTNAILDRRVSRIWGDNLQSMLTLAKRLEQGTADVIWFQHHPGHFSASDMELLTQSIRQSRYGIKAVTIHSVSEAARGGDLCWTRAFDIAFVHSAEDATRLSEAGHRNPVVVPHGFVISASDAPKPDPAYFTIGSFGFLNPHKNIDLLVSAFAVARRFEPRLRLSLFNCEQRSDQSRRSRVVVENLIRHYGLADHVSACFDFIAEDDLLSCLSTCDMFVFPYGHSTETATGAARIALSADRPILCSRSPVLRDLWPASHVLKSIDRECIAEALVSLAQSEDVLNLHDDARRDLVRRYSYDRAARRYAGHLNRLLGRKRDHRNAA